ncbi:MoaF-related domain-containing protein [Ralstonia syzygii subsp. celebesensis]|uniref:MoaF-like domain-containing protein n=1 Tax=blood disease bacterium A2-HR MARDI TaxID=1944648 RepID=A0A1U9VEA9_9RALS|nr:hypothetical protein [Ralstonia syzygii]AQW28623.1 hypothetical protein B0B51_00295 [blood disease bacterium A2-HR MARDI]QQV54784.1 hypothetical protein JK151_11545 [Ralstonia syzygii subsp. celebesensis]
MASGIALTAQATLGSRWNHSARKFNIARRAAGRQVEATFGDIVFRLTLKGARPMPFIGTAGSLKRLADTPCSTLPSNCARRSTCCTGHEPHTGMNVVHVEDLERGIAHTNIAVPDGSAQHLTDTLRILGDA